MAEQLRDDPQPGVEKPQSDAVRRKYTVTPAVIRQRSEAGRTHGLRSIETRRDLAALREEAPPPTPRIKTPWQRRRQRVLRRTETLLSQFPHLKQQPLTLVEQLAELELVKGSLSVDVVDGKEGAATQYTKATYMWTKLAIRLGVLPPEHADKVDPLQALLDGDGQ